MIQAELNNLLAELLHSWENEVVEFKNGGSGFSTDDIGEYFSALSNEANLRHIDRAWLVFGVENKTRTVIGSNYRSEPDHLNSLKMQITRDTDPSVSLREIHVLNHPDGRVILFEIPAAPRGIPIAWKGHYYARSGESKVALSLDKLEEIRSEGRLEDWTAQIVPDATIQHLDPEALKVARQAFALKHANRFSREEVESWSIETFLDRAKVTRDGKITRATLLLLGKAEAAHLLNPHPVQMTWKLVGQERAYEHFGPPFLLNTTELYQRIRNIQLRIIPEGTLLGFDVSKYDKKVVFEGIHNCIAHQDYTLNSRIIVTEYVDRLTLFNAGYFFEGKPEDYIAGTKTPSRYRNMMLATAMAELNMIDIMGYGIHEMFMAQARRGFPLQDYEQQTDSVTVTIYGHIIDNAYSTLLLKRTKLDSDDIVLLDRIQKKLEVSSEGLKTLRALHLITGRKPNIRIDANIADAVETLHEASTLSGAQVEGAQVEGAQVSQKSQVLQRNSLFDEVVKELQVKILSRKELSKFFDVSVRSGNLNRVITQLLVLGFIERTQRNPRAPNQAYRITDKGRKYLDAKEKTLKMNKTGK